MVAGHLREIRGYYHIVLSYTDENGKRKTPSKSTGLPVKGNKRKAEALLIKAREEMEQRLAENNVTRVSNKKESQILFIQFMKEWVEMMRSCVEITTYSAYARCVHKRIIPYFEDHFPEIKLVDITAKHIQDYYTYELTENKISCNTVLHRHANIHKALKYATQIGLIPANPADGVQRPKKEIYVASYYNDKELAALFEHARGDILELPIMLGAFYGLRRGEAVGLRWSAVDFERKRITINHTVTLADVDGKQIVVKRDRAKTKSSLRSLPLVPPFEQLLLKVRAQQMENMELCGNSYSTDYLEYIYVDKLGRLISPEYVSDHFSIFLKKHGLRKIRFHDLRHSCASLLYQQGVSLKEIQEWLGHSNISTTLNTYTHMDFSSKETSANAMLQVLPLGTTPSVG